MSAPVMPEESVDIDDDGPDESALLAAADAINADDALDAEVSPETDETTADAPTDAEGAEAAAVVAPVVPTFEPFAFNAFKQRYEVPGLRFDAKARAIVADDDKALERVKQMLSHGREWEARGRQELVQLRRENELIKTQPHAEIEQAKVYLDEWQKLMTMPEDALAAFLETARAEWPKIEARANVAYAEKLYQQAQAANEPPAPDVDAVIDEASHGAAELVREYLADQQWASPELTAELTEHLTDRQSMNHWIARATRDLPDEGVRKGQYVALWDDARAMLDKYTKPYRDAHAKHAAQQTAATEKIKQTQTVAATNAKTLALVKGKPAPVAPRVVTPPAKPKRETRDDIIAEAFGKWGEMKRAR